MNRGAQAQTSSDQIVANNAALKRSRGSKEKDNRSRLPAVITVIGVVAAFSWWRRSRRKDSNGEAGKSSAQNARQGRTKAADRIGRLPRNASSNNKKNKDRKKIERERRADKREREASPSAPSGSGRGKDDGDNSIILTSSFVDPHKSRTTNLPKLQKREAPSSNSGGERKEGSSLDPAFATELRRK